MPSKVERSWRENEQEQSQDERSQDERSQDEQSQDEQSDGQPEQDQPEQSEQDQQEQGSPESDQTEGDPSEEDPSEGDPSEGDAQQDESSGGEGASGGETPDMPAEAGQEGSQGEQPQSQETQNTGPEDAELEGAEPEDVETEDVDPEGDESEDGGLEDGEALHEETLGEIPQISEEDTSQWDDVRSQSTPDASGFEEDSDEEFYTDGAYRMGAKRVEEEIQNFAYEINRGDVGTDWTPGKIEDRRVARMLAVIIGKLAEDMSYQEIQGDEFWDAKKIMKRQIDQRPLHDCKKDYKQRKLALLVDTSPSCKDEAVFYSKISSGALLRNDVDIFLCPNGRIDARFDREHMRFVADDQKRDWELDGRTVLYFSDWDGSSNIVKQSKNCNLYWFDNTDPERFWEDPERRDTRTQFRGTHYHCPEKDEFIKLARKIRP